MAAQSGETAAQLLRAALRVSRKIPSEIVRKKFRYNAREMLEFYAATGDASRWEELRARGRRVLNTFDSILSGDATAVAAVFQPFDSFDGPRKTPQTDAAAGAASPPAVAGESAATSGEPIKNTLHF